MKNIKLIEVPSEIGAGTRGASLGVDAIKIAALDFMSNFFVHFPSEKIEGLNNQLFEPIQSPYYTQFTFWLCHFNTGNSAPGIAVVST